MTNQNIVDSIVEAVNSNNTDAGVVTVVDKDVAIYDDNDNFLGMGDEVMRFNTLGYARNTVDAHTITVTVHSVVDGKMYVNRKIKGYNRLLCDKIQAALLDNYNKKYRRTSKMMTISVSDEFKRDVKKKAHKNELSISEFMRKCVDAYKGENWRGVVAEVEREMRASHD